MRKSTGIRIEKGKVAEQKSETMARSVAQAMEAAALGQAPIDKACDAVRKAGELYGMAGRMPTVQEYLDAFPRTSSEGSEKNRTRAFKLFCEFLGADASRRLDTITPARCQAFIRWALGRVAKGTVEKYRNYVGAAFKRAVNVDNLMNKNPMAGVNLAVEAAAVNPDKGSDEQKRVPFSLAEIDYMIRLFPAPFVARVARVPKSLTASAH